MANSLILAKAQNAVTSHDWTTAARFYKELLRSDESNVEYLQQLGSIYVRGGQDEKAIPYYEKIISLNPDNTQAMVSLGGIFRRLKRYEESVNILHNAQEKESNSPTINYNLGFTYKEMGDYDDAIDSFESVISRNPDDVLAHNHLGSIYFTQKDYDKSISAYKHGLQVDQNHPILNYNLARVYEETKNYPESVRCFEIALKTRPGWVEAIRDFSELLIKCQNTKKAQELVEQSIKLHPNDVELLCILGRIYLNQFDFDNATNTFKRAEQLKENDINILIGLSKALEKGTKIDEAMEKILEAIDIAPENIDVCKQYAHVLLSAQRYEKALDLITAIDEKTQGKDCQVQDLYGQYFVCRGDEEAANTYFEKIKKLNQQYKDYLINAADRYFQTGNYAMAEKLAEDFVERKPQQPEGYNVLGTVQVARGNLAKAKTEYEKGISLKNPNIYAVKELEKIYNELEKNQELYDDDSLPVGLDADKLSKEEGGNLDDDLQLSPEGDDGDEKLDAFMGEEKDADQFEGGLEDNPPIEQALTGEDGDFWEDFDDDPDGQNQLIDEDADSENIYDENEDDPDLMSMMTPDAADTEDEEADDMLSDFMNPKADDEEAAAESAGTAESTDGAEPGEETVPAETTDSLEGEGTGLAENEEGAEDSDLTGGELADDVFGDDAKDADVGALPAGDETAEDDDYAWDSGVSAGDESAASEPEMPRKKPESPRYEAEPRYEPAPAPRDYSRDALRDAYAEDTLNRLRQLEQQQRDFAEEMKNENEKMIHQAVDEAVDKAVPEAVDKKLQEYDLQKENSNQQKSEIPEDDFELNLYDDEFTDTSFGDPIEESNLEENEILADSSEDDELDASFAAGPDLEAGKEIEAAAPETEIVPMTEGENEKEEDFMSVEEFAYEPEIADATENAESTETADVSEITEVPVATAQAEENLSTEAFITVEELNDELECTSLVEDEADFMSVDDIAKETEPDAEPEEDFFVTADDMLDKIERILNDDTTAKAYTAELELFKKLKVLAGFIPDNEKNSSSSCRMRMLIEYIIAKMSGKPGLLRTAESLIKSGVLGEEYNRQLEDTADEELSNDLICRVLKDMKELAQSLDDKELCNALCITADGILEQIALINQKCSIF